jgi:large subunit ribosomal protein L5
MAETKKTTTAAKTTASKTTAKKTAAPKAKSTVAKEKNTAVRLKYKYLEEVAPALMKEYNYKSTMETPKVEKVVINIGVGDATKNAKLLEESVAELTAITGQKPVITKAKKSIASFKLREGNPIGCKVTLRGNRMYQFLDKLMTISMPRIRDFHGVSKNSFDGRGNYTLGIKEQIIFPEINYDQVNVIRGMDIVIVTTANTDKEALSLLEGLGMPFTR